VNDRDQPVTVLADIEDRVSVYLIGIFEDLTYFQKVPPTRVIGEPVPGQNLSRRIWILLLGFNQVPAGNHLHGGLSKAHRSRIYTANPRATLRILYKLKRFKGIFAFCKVLQLSHSRMPRPCFWDFGWK
jgi:hypothetical protein